MMDPVLPSFGSWLLTKGFDLVVSKLRSAKGPADILVSAIDEAVRSDPKLADLCDDPPRLAKEAARRITDDEAQRLWLDNEYEELIELLRARKLLVLPGYRGSDSDLPSLWRCALQAAVNRLYELVNGNDQLWRDFQSFALRAIFSVVKDTQTSVAGLSGPFRQALAEGGAHGAPAPFGSIHAPQLVQDQVEVLTEELRDSLEALGAKTLAEVDSAILEFNWDKARLLFADFQERISQPGSAASRRLRGEVLVRLADMALRYEDEGDKPTCLREGRRYYREALKVFGNDLSGSDAERLERLAAKLEFLEGKPEDALRRLTHLESPEGIGLRLRILLSLDRVDPAVELIVARPLHERWCDSAVSAYIRAGRTPDADAAVEWSRDKDAVIFQRSCLAHAWESFHMVFEGEEHGKPIVKSSLSDQHRSQLTTVLELLSPVVAGAIDQGRHETGLQVAALELELTVCHLLGDQDRLGKAAAVLQSAKPVSLELARAAVREDIDCPADLPERLRRERPGSFDAQCLAARVQADLLHQSREALEALCSASGSAVVAGHHEDLVGLAYETAQKCGPEEVSRVVTLARDLLGQQHRLCRLIQCAELLRAGDTSRAGELLDPLFESSDPFCLQIRAALEERIGNWPEAVKWRQKACDLAPGPYTYRDLARAAHRARRLPLAAEALETLVDMQPRDFSARSNLAHVLADLGHFRRAGIQFEAVAQADPGDRITLTNAARCYALGMDFENAVRVLEARLVNGAPDLELVLMEAHVHRVDGHPDRACDCLERFRSQFWNEPSFVFQYMTVCHAAGRELQGAEAFRQILSLQRKGVVDQESVRSFSVSQAGEVFKSIAERHRRLNAAYLRGQAPWVFIASARNIPPYLAWRGRTDETGVRDDPDGRAEFSIYASHAFQVRQDATGSKQILRSPLPEHGVPFVADVSALITLHRLGLLEEAASYAGKILVPIAYQREWLDEQARLQPHQRSQFEAVEAIVDAISDDRIVIVNDESTMGTEGMPLLDETNAYPDAGPKRVALAQVVEWLAQNGYMEPRAPEHADQGKRNGVSCVPDEDAAALLDAGVLAAELDTLQKAHHVGVFDAIVAAFRLHMPAWDANRARAELFSYHATGEVAQWHRELAELIQKHPQFEFAQPPKPASTAAIDRDGERVYAFSAANTAMDQGLALLADDRACHVVVQNAPQGRGIPFFSTEVLLEAMADGGTISKATLASAYSSLMRWRYRFVLPPVDVLLTVAGPSDAGESRGQLHEVAGYVHDCMRDPGLLGGPEDVEPPISMAAKLYLEWLKTVVSFAMAVWDHNRDNDGRAAELTAWAMRTCLPGPPSVLHDQQQATLAAIGPEIVIADALTSAMCAKDADRARCAVGSVINSMGLREDQFAEIIARILDAVPGIAGESDDVVRQQIGLRIIRIAFDDLGELPPSVALAALRLGIGEIHFSDAPTSREELQALIDEASEERIPSPPGPFAFVWESHQHRVAHVRFVPELLAIPDPQLRQPVYQFLVESQGGASVYSPATGATLKAHEREVATEDSRVWGTAAGRIIKAFRGDFLVNLAGLDQSLAMRFEDGIRGSWPMVFEPQLPSLTSVEDYGQQLLSGPDGLVWLRSKLDRPASLSDLLNRYYETAGHLPLAEPLDLGTQLREFLADRTMAPAEVWDCLWAWAEGRQDPLRSYHACQALIACPEMIPPSKESEFWARTAGIASLCLRSAYESDFAQPWKLRAWLAKYYLEYLELRSRGYDPGRLVAISWWAATKVAKSLETHIPSGHNGEQRTWEWMRRTLTQRIDNEERLWLLVRPAIRGDAARYVTHRDVSPWGVALLCSLGERVGGLPLTTASTEQRETIAQAFGVCLLAGLTVVSSEGRSVWQWDKAIHGLAKQYADALQSDTPNKEGLQGLLAMTSVLTSPEGIEKALSELPEAHDDRSAHIVRILRAMCFAEAPIDELVWKNLCDSQWRRRCWEALPAHALDALIDGLLELQCRHGGDWHWEFPHLWFEAAIQLADDQQKARLFLEAGLLSSCGGHTVAAFKMLLKSQSFPKLRRHLREMRDQLTEFHNVSPSEHRAIVREMLAILSLA